MRQEETLAGLAYVVVSGQAEEELGTPPSEWARAVGVEHYVPSREHLVPEILEAGFGRLIEQMDSLAAAMASLGDRLGRVERELRAQPRCRQVTIYDLGESHYDLKQPLTVLIEEYEDETIARFPEVEAFASATTDGEAITLLKAEIVDLYEDLVSSSPEELGAVPKSWLRTLRSLIVADEPLQHQGKQTSAGP